MKNKWILIFLLFAFCGVCSFSAIAQDQSSARGNLGGLVYDSTKALVPGAQVTITGPIGSQTQTTTAEGSFLFSTLIPGNYAVKVQKTGFRVASIKSAEVLINKTTSIEVILETGQISEIVEVSAATVTVDTSASSVNSDFSDDFYSKIPLGRGVSSLFYLAPGVTSGLGTGQENPSISGSTGLENLYVADGVSINDPAFGGIGVWSRYYGPLGTGINLSFVKEVQIKTGGFEPQYGHVNGGIVQLVTKSGGTKFFGTAGGYFNARAMQTNFENADDPKFSVLNKVGSRTNNGNYEGDFELGGYVPLHGLKDRLFFFGTFNPSFNHEYWAPAIFIDGVPSGLSTIYKGDSDRYTKRYDYAAKLTFKINNSHTLESTISGDPSSTNSAPFAFLTAPNTSANSKWDYGTRNWAVRYDGAFGSNFLVDGAFTWSFNHFTETPGSPNVYGISDLTQTKGLPGVPGVYNGVAQHGQFQAQGLGGFEPYDSNTKSLQGDVTKIFHLFGNQHALSAGYNWQFPVYLDSTINTGPRFLIPLTNASGGDPGYATNPLLAGGGKQSDANLFLILASNLPIPNPTATCTRCPFMTIPGFATPQQVVLQGVRGRFDSRVTNSSGKYHAAFINDAWQMGKHVTLNVGVRWEQQRLIGNVANKLFNDSWSPRVGVIVDPKGDRKSKFYANYGRYAFILPLDAAVRELSSEDDFINGYWAPASTTTGCPTGTPAGAPCVVLNSFNTVSFVPDSAHLLNNASGGVPISPAIFASGGSPFAPGTRMEYTDEFLVGYDHEFRGGVVASVRYIDRRLKRVIEDQGGISVEQFNALAANGGGLNYFIGNPNAKQDIFVNPNEIVFGVGQTVATDGSALPAACFDSRGNPTPFVAYNQFDGFAAANGSTTPAGSACFPAVNTNTWTDSSGNLLPTNVSDPAKCNNIKATGCAFFGGEFFPDGKPDTYKDPKREYEAVEFEVRKSFSHNWALAANYRIAQLRGNYEGAFRNDNGQADPGISSLFDLTEGNLGLLRNQQSIGFLNSDRKHVLHVHTTYVLPNGRMKGLVLGAGVTVQSGIPLTTLVAQQAYQNQGEVPFFGRGDLGRSPVTGTVDAHVEYPWRLTERLHLSFGFDVFNIANSKRQTTLQQFNDLSFGVKNTDFQKPVSTLVSPGFVAPFSSRASIKLVF